MLGNKRGRPPVREQRRIIVRLKKHWALMQKYMAEGLSQKAASAKAYDEVIHMKIKVA